MTIPLLTTGWIPDLPDPRDFTAEHEKIRPILARLKVARLERIKLPARVDLREGFPPVLNQGGLQACTAHTGVALLDYFQKRVYKNEIQGSRMFLWKTERDLLGVSGNQGAFLRTAMQSLAMFGVPPEQYWPYRIELTNMEPPAFLYALARNYQVMQYYRYDSPDTSRPGLLQRIKANLAAQLPAMFGFFMYPSITTAMTTGKIPFPILPDEQPLGAHALVAAGYDDEMRIENKPQEGEPKETVGALLIRNSWGAEWGEEGYGWLPYEYVLGGLATDWWSVISAEYIDLGDFGMSDNPPDTPNES